SPLEAQEYLNKRQMKCACGEALWTLKRDAGKTRSRDEVMTEALTQIPTIGQKTADKLLKMFGADRIGSMLEDNVYEFINLMDEDGELVFTDRQSRRMERAMATTEFSFGTGG
ncbi:helicase, partial [Enterobacter hormaechei]|nr:helicase [Enterobacter hormaechei]